MPNPSIKNEPMYRALRRQGMSKARAARISNAARFKAATLGTLEAYVSASDYAPPVAQALASLIPELPAFKGESLGPGITRIRGNLCNVHGRYGPCDAALSGKKPKGRAGAKTPEQRQAERQAARAQQQQANRASVTSALAEADASLGPTGVASVLAAMDGGEITNGPALERLGYAEQNPDGSYRLTPEARALARAASRGDARAALDADGRAQERAKKTAAAAEKKKKLEDKKPKGGGGGKKQPSADEKRQAQQQQRQATAATTAAQVGLRAEDADALRIASEQGAGGLRADQRAPLDRLGLLDDNDTTDAGRRALAALERGDVRGYRAAVQDAASARTRQQDRQTRATERQQQQATRDADREQRRADTATRRAETDRRRAAADRRRERADRRAAARAESAQLGLRKRRKEAGRRKWGKQRRANDYPDQSQFAGYTMEDWDDTKPDSFYKAKSFAVYKAADGTPRWLARSTTAYRDRDGEILSVAALDADSQRMTATKQYGPLRWWHVGRPDPANPTAPWGPGLDLGDCDFSMVIGRTRVESGTFKSAAIARAVARVADSLELSPGFFHPPTAPDAGGVFTQIRTFERSLVPTRYARASNLFTGLTVKESRMDDIEFKRRLKAAIMELSLNRVEAATLGQDLAQTDKTAEAAGIAFKSQDAPTVYLGPDGTPGIIQGGAWVALKAATPPAPPEVVAAVEEKAPELEMEVEEPTDESYAPAIGDMTPDEFGALLDARLAPLIKALDIAGKMGGHMDELKSMMSGVATKEAGLASEVAALKTQVAELAGDAPRVLAGGYRASAAAATVVPDGDARLKEAAPGNDPIMAAFGGFLSDLGLTPGA